MCSIAFGGMDAPGSWVMDRYLGSSITKTLCELCNSSLQDTKADKQHTLPMPYKRSERKALE